MSGSQIQADFWLNDYMTPWDMYAHGIIRYLTSQKTNYQQMDIVETGLYGRALVLDGKWQSCTGDEFLYHEPLVHPPLICHGNPRSVLILGGGEGATLREVLRWKTVEEAVMVDLDEAVVEACRKHLPEMAAGVFEDPRVTVHIDNAINFLDTTSRQWDIIISDLSEPVEYGPSFPLFTREYFQKMAKLLQPDGCLVVQAGSTSPVRLDFHAKIANTIAQIFPNIQSYSSSVPSFGEPWGFILASAEPIPSRPDPKEVDRLLAEKTTGGFRMLDGSTLLGLFQIPIYLREAIAAETGIYTLSDPPKEVGQGILKDSPTSNP